MGSKAIMIVASLMVTANVVGAFQRPAIYTGFGMENPFPRYGQPFGSYGLSSTPILQQQRFSALSGFPSQQFNPLYQQQNPLNPAGTRIQNFRTPPQSQQNFHVPLFQGQVVESQNPLERTTQGTKIKGQIGLAQNPNQFQRPQGTKIYNANSIGLMGRSAGTKYSHKCKETTPAENKAQVLRAYQSALGDHISDNLEQDWATDYIQHNPFVADGLEPFRKLIISLQGNAPTKLDIKRVAADGDLVWIHSRSPFLGKMKAIVNIFRVQCGKIQEHWDVMQDVELTSPAANPHPFF